LRSGRDTFAIKEWLAADADVRSVSDKTLANGITCDEVGCVGRLRDGRLVAMPLSTEAAVEDCTRAAIVVTSRFAATKECQALLFDREVLRDHGAVALRLQGKHFEIEEARPPSYQRPWAQSLPPVTATPVIDATPPSDQLEAGD
jgi:competence protein ComEC